MPARPRPEPVGWLRSLARSQRPTKRPPAPTSLEEEGTPRTQSWGVIPPAPKGLPHPHRHDGRAPHSGTRRPPEPRPPERAPAPRSALRAAPSSSSSRSSATSSAEQGPGCGRVAQGPLSHGGALSGDQKSHFLPGRARRRPELPFQGPGAWRRKAQLHGHRAEARPGHGQAVLLAKPR